MATGRRFEPPTRLPMTEWEEESGCPMAQAQHSGCGEADSLRRTRINLFPVAQRDLYTPTCILRAENRVT